MPIEPRRELANLPPPVHGSPNFEELRRLGMSAGDVLDFSVNVNPYGPAPAAREVLARTDLARYPDRDALALRAALAERIGVSPHRILVCNGASEAIWLVGLAFLRPGDRVVVLGPTYCEYERVAIMMGAKVTISNAKEEDEFQVKASEVSRLLEQCRPRAVFLANPNNPTGTTLEASTIRAWASRFSQTLFVVDEAYLAFAPGLASAFEVGADNILVLRSMTKDHALAGLRLGYAVGCEEWIRMLARVQPPWSVNAFAQAAGVASLKDMRYLDESLAKLMEEKKTFQTSISAAGLEVLSSATHYFLVRVGNGASFRLSLLRRGILVRDGASFGLPEHVRIATRLPEENAQLLAEIMKREASP